MRVMGAEVRKLGVADRNRKYQNDIYGDAGKKIRACGAFKNSDPPGRPP